VFLQELGKQLSPWRGLDAEEGEKPFHVGLHRLGVLGICMLFECFAKRDQVRDHGAIHQ
jgi:hypothetical protein